MNRYMYVEGNPVKYRDPDGHNKTKDFFNNLGENMMGGAAWASGGLARAGDTYNTFTGNRKYQGKNDFRRSDISGIHGGKAWDSIVGKDGLFGWLHKATGWKRLTKWWDYQTKDKELDYNRELIGGIIEDSVCKDDPNSINCRNVKILRGMDRNAQSKKYYNKRDINLTTFYKDEGSGYRIECVTDNQGNRQCIPVSEDMDFNPDIYIAPGPNQGAIEYE
ncbi:MAG: hypothetical protein IPL26_10115 [Leptospiraceae bacterium]|nr:hypothetical protein [Leptospiraceae bacterium]